MFSLKSQQGVDLLIWDPDEEEAVAQLVIDLLLYVGIEEQHYVFLREVFLTNSKGNLMQVQDLIELTNLISYYEDLGVEFRFHIPDLPFRKTPYVAKRSKSESDPDWVDEETHRLKEKAFHARLWKSVWERNPSLHQYSTFNPFPGDFMFDQAEQAQQSTWNAQEELDQERRFQDEVRKIARKFGITQYQAELHVRDYMPRGLDRDGIPLVEKLYTQEERDKDLPLHIRLDRMLHSEEE